MRKFFLAFMLLSLLILPSVQAAPVPVPPNATLQDLINTNAGGGVIVQDKIFSNFAFSSATTTASNVRASSVFNPGAVQDVHGWVFSAINGLFTSNFTLGYTVTVAPGNPGVALVGSADQMNVGFTPQNASVTDTQTPGTISVTGTSPATETAQITYSPITTLTTSAAAVIASGARIVSFEQDFIEQVVVPIPPSILLLGSGLIGMVAIYRRKR